MRETPMPETIAQKLARLERELRELKATRSVRGHEHTEYAADDHTHPASEITSGTLAIARIPTGTSGSTVALGNHTHDNRYPRGLLGYASRGNNTPSTATGNFSGLSTSVTIPGSGNQLIKVEGYIWNVQRNGGTKTADDQSEIRIMDGSTPVASALLTAKGSGGNNATDNWGTVFVSRVYAVSPGSKTFALNHHQLSGAHTVQAQASTANGRVSYIAVIHLGPA